MFIIAENHRKQANPGFIHSCAHRHIDTIKKIVWKM